MKKSLGSINAVSQLLLFALKLLLPTIASGACPIGWFHWEAGKACYWKSQENDRRDFYDSLSVCMNMGATLASENNDEEFSYINTIVRNCLNGRCNFGDDREQYWIGLYKDQNLGSNKDLYERRSGWNWINQDLSDRTPLDPVTQSGGWHKWYEVGGNEEPTGGFDDKCGRITYNGEWADRECTNTYRFICKKVTQDPLRTSGFPSVQATNGVTKTKTGMSNMDITIRTTSRGVGVSTNMPSLPTSHDVTILNTNRPLSMPGPNTYTPTITTLTYMQNANTTRYTTTGSVFTDMANQDHTILIVYIIIGVTLFIILITLLAALIVFRRNKRREVKDTTQENGGLVMNESRPVGNERHYQNHPLTNQPSLTAEIQQSTVVFPSLTKNKQVPKKNINSPPSPKSETTVRPHNPKILALKADDIVKPHDHHHVTKPKPRTGKTVVIPVDKVTQTTTKVNDKDKNDSPSSSLDGLSGDKNTRGEEAKEDLSLLVLSSDTYAVVDKNKKRTLPNKSPDEERVSGTGNTTVKKPPIKPKPKVRTEDKVDDAYNSMNEPERPSDKSLINRSPAETQYACVDELPDIRGEGQVAAGSEEERKTAMNGEEIPSDFYASIDKRIKRDYGEKAAELNEMANDDDTLYEETSIMENDLYSK